MLHDNCQRAVQARPHPRLGRLSAPWPTGGSWKVGSRSSRAWRAVRARPRRGSWWPRAHGSCSATSSTTREPRSSRRSATTCAVYRHLDVTSEADWRAAVATAADRFGGLHVLVSNAGISPMPRPIVDTPVEKYRKVIEVNQIGMFTGIHTCAPLIAESCADGPSGSIVARLVGQRLRRRRRHRGLRLEQVRGARAWRRSPRSSSGGATCAWTRVHPGPIDTAMIQPESWGGFDMRPILAKGSPLGRVGTPDDVAELVCFLASDTRRVDCTGSEFVVDGGYLAGPFDALGVDS